MKKLGDAIAAVATPIARALHMDCIDPDTQDLLPESGCARRKQMLNQGRYADAVLSFFTADQIRKTKGEKTMTFIVTKQIQIDAETPEDAIAKCGDGKTVSLSVSALRVTAPVPSGQNPVGTSLLGKSSVPTPSK